MTKSLYKALGFSKAEIKVWQSIAENRSLLEIIKDTELPRSTVVDILKRFEKRGLVNVSSKLGTKFFVRNESLDFGEKMEVGLGEISKVVIHRGHGAIMKAYEVHRKSHNIRWQLYMSNASLKSLLQNEDIESVISLNNAIRENKQITELFVEQGGKSYFEVARDILSAEDYKGWLESLERMCVMYEVPKKYFHNTNDVFLFQDSAFITNWKKEFSVEVKQEETVLLLKSLFELLKVHARQVDFRSILRDAGER